jgi:hypothetical protein
MSPWESQGGFGGETLRLGDTKIYLKVSSKMGD